MPQIGDIVKVLDSGEKKIIVGSRIEIVPSAGNRSKTYELKARIVYRLAGKVDRWFSEQDISIFSPRKP